MKKTLLVASSVILTTLASIALAEVPTVTIGGMYNFQMGAADQKDAYKTGANSRDVKFANLTKIDVKVNGKSDHGFNYGAVVRLEGDVTSAPDEEGLNSDKTYLFLESESLGRLEAGSNYGAAKTMKVDGTTFARGTGGADGLWYYYVNTAVGTGAFLLGPDLPIDNGKVLAGDMEDSTKVTYYTPRFSGLQLGVSYTPDTGNNGTAAALTTDHDAGDYSNAFSLGLNYNNKFGELGVIGSATAQFGDAEISSNEDLRAYALGLNVTYSDFTVGGSYGNWDKSGMAKSAPNKDVDYWTLGAAYAHGPVGASISYLDSSMQNNDLQLLSVSSDYQLAPGLVPYAEVSFFKLDSATAATPKNKGTVLLLGTQLNF